MVSQVTQEYVLLRNQLSMMHTQMGKLNKEQIALEKRCSALGSELTEEDLPDLKLLLVNPYSYASIQLRICPPKSAPVGTDLPWTT